MRFDLRRLPGATVGVLALTLSSITVPVVLSVGTPVAAAAPGCNTTTNRFVGSAKATLPAYGNSLDCELGLGDSGNAVEYLQISLIKCNNADTGGVDGDYGPKTRDTIAWIQAANGLEPDGIYGPRTRKVIWWAFNDGRCRRWTGS